MGPLAAGLGFRQALMIMAGLPLLTGFLALALPDVKGLATSSITEVSQVVSAN
jgi:hypothetical protein